MRFFTYSPLDYSSAQDAFNFARPHLDPCVIVHVLQRGHCRIEKAKSGQRPQALPETYLVRVEQDESLRVVQKSLS